MVNENAKKGIGRIYNAEILSILAAIIAIVATVLLTLFGKAVASEGKSFNITDVISVISMIIGLVLAIVSFFLSLTGIRIASDDEQSFSSALVALILQVVFSVLKAIFGSKSIAGALGTAENIAEILVTYFVIQGCINLAKKLKNQEVEALGNNTLKLIIIVWLASILLDIISSFVGSGNVGSVIGAILGIAALVCTLISYILYLKLLRKTIAIL